MRMSVSVGCSATVRAFVYVLTVFALTLQQLAPLCLVQSAATGGHSVVLCTVAGMRTVPLGADGKPIPNAPTEDQGPTCCACFQGSQGVAAAEIVAFDAAPPIRVEIAASSHRPYPKPYLLYVSTGPPRLPA
jgi:hypothetical protein